MNSQMEALDRRLPMQLVCYHIYLRLLHSGMSARQVVGLPPAEFGRFIGECCQVTRDACLVPYERDTTVGVQITFSNGFGFGLGLRDTEDMVSPSFFTTDCAYRWLTLSVGRVYRVARPSSSAALSGRCPLCTSPTMPPSPRYVRSCAVPWKIGVSGGGLGRHI